MSKKFPMDYKWENGVSKLALSILIGSSSNLLETRTGIKSWISLISGQIGHSLLSYLPLSDENFAENNVSTLMTSVLIRSSSNFQVTRTDIESRTNSISSQLGLFALELVVLE